MTVLNRTRARDNSATPSGLGDSSGSTFAHTIPILIAAVMVLMVQTLSPSAATFGGVLKGRGQEKPAQQDSGSKGVSSRTDGASSSAGADSTASGGGAIVASSEDYRIGPSDVIDVRVEDAPELSRTFTVASDGTFQMPYLHQMNASQKTTQQLEKMITDGLKGRYLVDPHVTVSVLKFNSRSYYIEGAVHNPGVYIIQGKASLMKLITIAGGLADNHGSTAFIIRQAKLDPTAPNAAATATPAGGTAGTDQAEPEKAKYELITAHVNGLFRGEFNQDKLIEPGDIVNIPLTDVFFVSGEVHKAGSFSLKEGTTLRQAISMAEGTTFRAAVHRVVIFRENPATGKREEITVDVGRVMAGKMDDMPILANDVIEIPNSKSKTAFSAFLNGLGQTAMRAPVP